MFLGSFNPQSIDARDANDVLVQDSLFLSTLNRDSGIDINQFNNVTVGGEWLFGLGHFIDGGLGLAFYQRTVPVVDTNNFNPTTGGNIEAGLKLRMVPLSATLRFLPLGRGAFEPYIGGGINVYVWRYSESGQFVDYSSCDTTGACNIVQATSVGSGTAAGPVVLGGVRFPMGVVSIGGEIRWQGGSANLPSDQGFAGSKIDLGGMNYLLTLKIPF